MSDDLSLFGDDQPPAPVEPRTPTPIADWQIDLLRKALDARGLSTMAERQAAVQEAVRRDVDSLRSLTHDEAIQVLGQVPGGGVALRFPS